jgi:hypothetical protein
MSKRSPKKSKRRNKAAPALGITGLSLSLASGAIASTGQAVDVPSTSQPPEFFLGEEEIFDTSLSTFFTFDKENAGETSPAQMLKLAKGGCGGGCGCGHGGGCGCGHGGGCGCGGHYGGGGCGCGHGGGYMGCAGGAKGMGMTCAGAKGMGMTCAGAKGMGMTCAGRVHGVHCRCAFFRRCFGCGCGGCGGWWGCGTCWIWTPTWGWVNTCWGESTPPAEVASVASEPVAQTAEVAVKRK